MHPVNTLLMPFSFEKNPKSPLPIPPTPGHVNAPVPSLRESTLLGLSLYHPPMKQLAAILFAAVVAAPMLGAQPTAPPSVDQILSLKRAGSPEISPDGRRVAYTVRDTNWDDNAYE